MKTIVLSVLAFSSILAQAQNVVFNDPDLKQRVVGHGQSGVGSITGLNIGVIDTDNNGEISIAEAQNYTGRLYLNQNGSNFYTDLTGLEEFINITELFCQNNQMTSLDVSSNTKLTLLDCEYNQISSLDLSNNTELVTLNYSYNNLPNVDLTGLVDLTKLVCDNSNITTLSLTNNVNLLTLECQENSITSLDLTGNVNLQDVVCRNNAISSIDLTNNVNLEYITISDNSLTSLDVSQNVNLAGLYCPNNEITGLDLSDNIILTSLTANNNEMTYLFFASELGTIRVSNNKLTELDFSSHPYISELDCSNNELTYLNLANGNNNAGFYSFDATGNADLTCIQVDDVTFSATNWFDIDTDASFNLSCPVLVTSIAVTSQSSDYTIITDGGTLQMEAAILPLDATDATYTWSVNNVSGAATIDASGVLTATNNGVVTVVAAANDGSGIESSVDVTISNQTMASINGEMLVDVSVYPNPTTSVLRIESAAQIDIIEVYNLMGEKVKSFSKTNSIDVTNLSKGIYMLKIMMHDKILVTKKLIKE